jgi:hypothetical protein
MVLLLLFRRRVLRPLLPGLLAIVFSIVGSVAAAPADAAQRTFVLTPADVVVASDLFGAKALSRSAALGKMVGLRRGALRFAKGTCPSLLADPTRKITRIRVLGGPAGAPLVVGKTLAAGLSFALDQMGAASWFPPTSSKTRQAHWIAEPAAADVVGFSTGGFAVGDLTGALGASEAANRVPGFRFSVDLSGASPGTGSVEIAIALTSELPTKKLGRPGKRTECILVATLVPADLQAVRDLLAATPGLTDVTRHRLVFILDTAQDFLDRGVRDRGARNIRTFALEVAQRSEVEIVPGSAEALINRANLAVEALYSEGFDF